MESDTNSEVVLWTPNTLRQVQAYRNLKEQIIETDPRIIYQKEKARYNFQSTWNRTYKYKRPVGPARIIESRYRAYSVTIDPNNIQWIESVPRFDGRIVQYLI
jgi:hypothetical protein